MNLILTLILIVLAISLAGLVSSYRHKRISSEIIRRLDEHHQASMENIDFLKSRAEKVSQEANEIRQFLESLTVIDESSSDIDTFIKTSKLTR